VLTGVVAGVIVEWYWSSHDEDHAETKKGCCCHKPHPDGHHPKMAPLPILRSFKNVVRYYLGSMANGSFWIAFILFLRFVVAYIVSQTTELQKKNKILLYIGKCVLVSRGLGGRGKEGTKVGDTGGPACAGIEGKTTSRTSYAHTHSHRMHLLARHHVHGNDDLLCVCTLSRKLKRTWP
jgi:hypothetical protein